MSHWIAVDWGTTNLRAWHMSGAGQGGSILDTAQSDDGMGRLQPADFEGALLALIDPWLPAGKRTSVVACGMVGSRQGWTEAAYQTVPCAPMASDTPVRAPATDLRLSVHILRGIKQLQPADVMRGEETQIAGFLAKNPDFDGVLCLPGTHTKWVHISAGEVVSFRTFMSGEMFAVLAGHSVLRHSVASDGWEDGAFQDGLAQALSKPESLASEFFAIRANGLLHDVSGVAARSRLSGLLIGAELAAARAYWLGQNVALIGAAKLSQIYAAALQTQGLQPVLTDADAMTLAGLTAAHASITQKG